MLTKLKQRFQKLLSTQAEFAQRLGLTPNIITFIGIIVALMSAYAYTQWEKNSFYLLVAGILLLLSGYFDALDGALARHAERVTVFGGYLDSLLDRYADSVVYFGVVISKLCETTIGIAALIGSLLVSYSRARAESIGIKMETIGIMERPERILILVAATLLACFWRPAIEYAILILAILTNFTVLQRAVYTYKKLKARSVCQTEDAALHAP